jgi:hypothetical protein
MGEEHSVMVFENTVLKTVFWSKKHKIIKE